MSELFKCANPECKTPKCVNKYGNVCRVCYMRRKDEIRLAAGVVELEQQDRQLLLERSRRVDKSSQARLLLEQAKIARRRARERETASRRAERERQAHLLEWERLSQARQDRLRNITAVEIAKDIVDRSTERLRLQAGDNLRTYFISDGEFIKIGYSFAVQERLRTLQTGCPRELSVLLSLIVNVEEDLHRVFAHERIRGEWFKSSRRLLDTIALLQGTDIDADVFDRWSINNAIAAIPSLSNVLQGSASQLDKGQQS